jgi:hypothetical protein
MDIGWVTTRCNSPKGSTVVVLMGLGFELRALHLQSRYPSPFCSDYFGDAGLANYLPSCPQSTILPISVSLVARITTMRHQHPASRGVTEAQEARLGCRNVLTHLGTPLQGRGVVGENRKEILPKFLTTDDMSNASSAFLKCDHNRSFVLSLSTSFDYQFYKYF